MNPLLFYVTATTTSQEAINKWTAQNKLKYFENSICSA